VINMQVLPASLLERYKLKHHNFKRINKVSKIGNYDLDTKTVKWYKHVGNFVERIGNLITNNTRMKGVRRLYYLQDIYKAIFDLDIIIDPESFQDPDKAVGSTVQIRDIHTKSRYEVIRLTIYAVMINYILKGLGGEEHSMEEGWTDGSLDNDMLIQKARRKVEVEFGFSIFDVRYKVTKNKKGSETNLFIM